MFTRQFPPPNGRRDEEEKNYERRRRGRNQQAMVERAIKFSLSLSLLDAADDNDNDSGWHPISKSLLQEKIITPS